MARFIMSQAHFILGKGFEAKHYSTKSRKAENKTVESRTPWDCDWPKVGIYWRQIQGQLGKSRREPHDHDEGRGWPHVSSRKLSAEFFLFDLGLHLPKVIQYANCMP